MVLPPFESLGNAYRQSDRIDNGRSISAAERYNRVQKLRQKFGEHILGEALHVASSLRRKLRDGHAETEVEIVDTYVESRFRRRGLVPLRKFRVTHNSEVRGRYRGWKLVQAHWAMGDYVVRPNPDGESAMPMVTPGHVACRGIALLTDGRILPYDTSNKQAEVGPDWQADGEWKQDSLGCALVQESQVTDDYRYNDTWPMHLDMRRENAKWPPEFPTWTLTTPGPDTRVYGRGIREGLAALARCHEITIPEQIEPVQFIGNPFAHMEGGAAEYGLAWGRPPRR